MTVPIPSLAFLAILLAGVPWLAARSARSGQALRLPRPALYVSAAATQWVLFVLLAALLRMEGTGFVSIGLGSSPQPGLSHGSAPSVVSLAALTVAAGVVLAAAFALLRRRLGLAESELARHLLPVTPRERLLFALLVAPTAGLVEESLYRGFAISRLAALVGDPSLAALAAALAFSLGHVYQGWIGVARAAALGCLLAIPFVATGSLWPSVIAHGILDLLFGIVLARWLVE